MLCLICVLVLFRYGAYGVAIDNGVATDPEISCSATDIVIGFNSQKPFNGKVFTKGFADNHECVIHGQDDSSIVYTAQFGKCGMRRTREPNGVAQTVTVIISFHPLFITKVDRAYSIRCFYMEAVKTLFQDIDVSMIPSLGIEVNVQMPTCFYEVLNGDDRFGAVGAPIRYARVGQKVKHRWYCNTETKDVFCMQVHSCSVDAGSEGYGGSPVQIVDGQGCIIDRYLLTPISYPGYEDLEAIAETHVFKFADKPSVYFNCHVSISVRDDPSDPCLRPVCPAFNTVPHHHGHHKPSPYHPSAPPQPHPIPSLNYVPAAKNARLAGRFKRMVDTTGTTAQESKRMVTDIDIESSFSVLDLAADYNDIDDPSHIALLEDPIVQISQTAESCLPIGVLYAAIIFVVLAIIISGVVIMFKNK